MGIKDCKLTYTELLSAVFYIVKQDKVQETTVCAEGRNASGGRGREDNMDI